MAYYPRDDGCPAITLRPNGTLIADERVGYGEITSNQGTAAVSNAALRGARPVCGDVDSLREGCRLYVGYRPVRVTARDQLSQNQPRIGAALARAREWNLPQSPKQDLQQRLGALLERGHYIFVGQWARRQPRREIGHNR